MKNYLCLSGKKIELTDAQVAEIAKSFDYKTRLADKPIGELAKIGDHEFIVLNHGEGETLLLKRDFLKKMKFGSDCDFKTSDVKDVLDAFAAEMADIVGVGNIVTHTVDLTSDDGLKDYGEIQARMSLLTCDLYRKYGEIIEEYEVDDWWWLATPYSTPKRGWNNEVKCVSPSGFTSNDFSYDLDIGVRPFWILKSDIFVS